MKRLVVIIMLSIATLSYADPYWVASDGEVTTWANCESASPLNGASACTLAVANSNASSGNIVYLRGGTYTITRNGIDPINSGNSDNFITFSAYQDETVTITGDTSISGVSSRGINLNGDAYIKITRINFTNVKQGLIIHSGGHNEISYCDFSFRDYYADAYLTGTAKSDASTQLYDTANDLSTHGGRMLFNDTDNSAVLGESPATSADIIQHHMTKNGPRLLTGGEASDKTWQSGDNYKIVAIQSYDPGHMDIGGNSTHNWVHHCVVHGGGALTPQGDEGTLFSVGFTSSASEENSNNTIEYNHIYHAGHHVFAINSGFFNVARGNYLHNEGWYDDTDTFGVCAEMDNGVCGYRVVYSVGHPDHVGNTLYESNAVGYGAQYGGPHPTTGGSGAGMALSNPDNIVRYNSYFANGQYGLGLASSLTDRNGIDSGDNNRIYNNTFFSNGHNWSSYGVSSEDDSLNDDSLRTGIHFYNFSGITDNVIKNNLFHNNWTLTNRQKGSVYYPDINALSETNKSNNTILNNYTNDTSYMPSDNPFTDTSDPAFLDEDLTTPLGGTVWSNYTLAKPDLRLQSGSQAINGGTYLTQTNGSGSSATTLIVDDAQYFQDGTWGSNLALLNADWIAIGDTSNTVEISSIDYATDTITLTSPMTWGEGDPVWLYKKSDGEIVLHGSAPDYGAFEFQDTPIIDSPAGGSSSGGGCFFDTHR